MIISSIDFDMILYIFLVAVRLLPMLVLKIDPSDKWSHLLDAQIINQNGGCLPESTDRFVPRDDFSYPPGVANFLSILPSGSREKIFIIMNIFLNLLEATIWYVIAMALGAGREFLLLIIFMPGVLSPWYGLYGINARNFAAILLGFYVLLVFYIESDAVPHVTGLILGVIFVIILYTSKFGLQALFAISLIFSIYYYDPYITLYTLYPLIFIIFSNQKWMLRVLRGWYRHCRFLYLWGQYHSTTCVLRNLSPYEFCVQIKTDGLRRVLRNIAFFPLIRCMVLYPIIPTFLVMYSLIDTTTLHAVFALQLLLFSMCILLITSHFPFKFLGEPDRYIMFGPNIFLILATAELLTMHDYGRGIASAYCIFSFIILLRVFFMRKRMRNDNFSADEEKTILNEIATTDQNAMIITSPSNLADKFALYSNHKFFGIHTNCPPKESSWDVLKEIYTNYYPYPDLSKIEKMKQYQIKFLVIDKNANENTFTNLDQVQNGFHTDKLMKIKETKRYICYKI